LDDDIEHRPDLTPPEKPKAVWSDYINSSEGQWPCLSRPIRCKESKKEFKAQLAIVIFTKNVFYLFFSDFISIFDFSLKISPYQSKILIVFLMH